MARFDKTESINIEDIVIEKEKVKKPKKDENIEKPKKEEKKIQKEEKKEVKAKKIDIYEKNSLEDIVKNDYQEQTIINIYLNDSKKIGIASDHRGYKMKQKLTKYLNEKGYTVIDYGGEGIKGDDYTEFGFKLGEAIKNNKVEKGIAICGSGIGISIACNKVSKVRCAKVDNTKEVKWARKDNDANAIAISAKMPLFRAKDIVDVFLKTKFSYAERHQRRIDALNNYKG